MSNYNFNSTVSSQEAEALKAMIFKRAQERAHALVEDTQKKYTDSFQAEVMELARESFVANKNPFSQKTEHKALENKAEPVEIKQKDDTLINEIGFANRHINEIKAQIHYRNKDVNDSIANKEVASAMDYARETTTRKQSFTGALEFLNSQASIALIENRKSKFEAIA